MAIELSDLKEYARLLSKGLVIEFAPGIAKGIFVELLKSKNITVKSASDWIQNNISLWERFKPSEQVLIKNLVDKAGSIDWLDADWIVNAIKDDLPTIASLFLGWKKANNWLKRQVEIIKKEVEEECS